MRNLDMVKENISKGPELISDGSRFIIMAAAFTVIVIFIIGLSFYLLLRSEKSLRERINSLDSRLLKIEERLTRTERSQKSNSIIDEQRTKLETSLMNRMDSLDALINIKNKKTTADTLHSEAIKRPVKREGIKKKPSADLKKYHAVAPGETLYRISVNYNMSVDELRRLNSISPQSVIHIGQKLQISK